MDSVKRRRFLIAAGAGPAGLLTGCIDGGGDGNGEQNGTEDEAEGTESGDGGEGTDDGEDVTESGGDTDTDEESVSFGEVYSVSTGNEFAFEAELKDEESTTTGRHYQGDTYVRFETEQGTGEYYEVDDNQYLIWVDEGMCIKNPGSEMSPSEEESEVDTDEYESDVQEYASLSPSGTTTIDGEEMYIFEPPEEEATYYVSVNSGYLRRVETSRRVVDLHSWGDVEPIETPDMECQDMSDMPSGF
jgi:hypothetical protein